MGNALNPKLTYSSTGILGAHRMKFSYGFTASVANYHDDRFSPNRGLTDSTVLGISEDDHFDICLRSHKEGRVDLSAKVPVSLWVSYSPR